MNKKSSKDQLITRIILVGSDPEKLNHLLSEFGERINQIHFHGEIVKAADLKGYEGKTVKVFSGSREDVIRHSSMLKERRFFICPRFSIEKQEDISLITSMGIAVDLLYRIEDIERGVLNDILHFYLHHPALSIPIEPFHSILFAKIRDRKINLWGLYSMLPAMEFISDGTVTPGDGLYHTLLTRGQKGLKRYFDSIPKEYPGCMSCDQFYFCFSWGRFRDNYCELWKSILDHLQKDARKIRDITRKAL